MIRPIRGGSQALLALLSWTAWILFGANTMIQAAENLSEIKGLVSKLTASSVESPKSVEETFGIKLIIQSGGAPFSLWIAESLPSKNILIKKFDYRHPEPSGRADGGPMLVLSIVPKVCITVDDIRDAFPSAQMTGVPRGTRGAKFYLSLPANGGELSFGLAAEQPRCLNTIVFKAGSV